MSPTISLRPRRLRSRTPLPAPRRRGLALILFVLPRISATQRAAAPCSRVALATGPHPPAEAPVSTQRPAGVLPSPLCFHFPRPLVPMKRALDGHGDGLFRAPACPVPRFALLHRTGSPFVSPIRLTRSSAQRPSLRRLRQFTLGSSFYPGGFPQSALRPTARLPARIPLREAKLAFPRIRRTTSSLGSRPLGNLSLRGTHSSGSRLTRCRGLSC